MIDIIKWIQAKRPGRVERLGDRIEITHDTGEHSTIWVNTLQSRGADLEHLSDIYHLYDGMDLFSSTFKIAAINEPKGKSSVVLVQSLAQFAADVKSANPCFPEPAIPFMHQAGIGFYAVGTKSGKIYEWDMEEQRLSAEYANVFDILNEWLKAMS
jgi:hypothetical protein